MVSLSIWHWLFVLVTLLFLALPLILKFGFGIGAKPVPLKHPVTGQLKNGYFGFSWTYFFFGWWVPLLRGELAIAALHFLFSFLTFGLWQVIACFFFNKQYTNRRISEGFRLYGTSQQNTLAAQAIGLDLHTHLMT